MRNDTYSRIIDLFERLALPVPRIQYGINAKFYFIIMDLNKCVDYQRDEILKLVSEVDDFKIFANKEDADFDRYLDGLKHTSDDQAAKSVMIYLRNSCKNDPEAKSTLDKTCCIDTEKIFTFKKMKAFARGTIDDHYEEEYIPESMLQQQHIDLLTGQIIRLYDDAPLAAKKKFLRFITNEIIEGMDKIEV